MNPTQEIKVAEDKSLDALKSVLSLVQFHLENVLNEVERSDALLKVGEKTTLSKQIEEQLNNPMKAIFSVSSNIDQQVKQLVERYVKNYLQTKAAVIHSVYQTKTNLNDLHYSIVLKEDSTENREQIFGFLDEYDLFNFSHRYPVYFQFVSIDLIDKIHVKEAIKLS